jgi:hypothetical protein
VAARYDGEPADTMVAIHAWRSAEAVRRFKLSCPERPLVLQLSGTDIYQYISEDHEPTLRSMTLADGGVTKIPGWLQRLQLSGRSRKCRSQGPILRASATSEPTLPAKEDSPPVT